MVENILRERYYQEGEKDWSDIAYRVSNFIGEDSDEREKFYNIILDKKFIPASPFLMNAGTLHPQLFSCFVLPVEDNLDSIFKFYAQSAKIFKSSGGVGADWSKLRAKGEPLSGGGVTSGVCSFLKVFNSIIETVKQGGVKKGAAIASLDIYHPEIKDFISMKLQDGDISNINISPRVTDYFMESVKKGYSVEKELFDYLVNCTWNCSEPGMQFIDTANRYRSVPGLGKYEASNPCVRGDTRLYTPIGEFTIEECEGLTIDIWNGFQWSTVIPYKTSDSSDIYQVKVKCIYEHAFAEFKILNLELNCTENHIFLMKNGERRQLKDIGELDELLPWYYVNNTIINSAHIESIKKLQNKYPTYCVTEPFNHSCMFNGIVTGQCSERFLLPYESCCLGGINWFSFVRHYADGVPYFDYDEFERVIRIAIRFLDNALDKNDYPLPDIKTATLLTRRIGQYPIGIADVLMEYKLPYDSQEARNLCKNIWKFQNDVAWDESSRIGIAKGAFPAYEKSIFHESKQYRNAAVTCVAPSGTTSIIAGCNFGIEPFFSHVMSRSQGSGQGYIISKYLEEYVTPNASNIIESIYKTGSIKNTGLPEYFKSALDINWKGHIDMMVVFQKECIDGTISKTVNLPASATKQDISDAFIYAWEQECRGITFYREGTRKGVYTLKEQSENNIKDKSLLSLRKLSKRPKELWGVTSKHKTGCGKLYINLPECDGKLYECFLTSKGGCSAMYDFTAQLISAMLRHGINPREISKIGKGVTCLRSFDQYKKGLTEGKSCGDIIARRIEECLPDIDIDEHPMDDVIIINGNNNESVISCPECGKGMIFVEGCKSCPECGYSRCN